jgi:putative transcriptional regulator
LSEILDIASDMARDLFKVGAMDEITLRKIDALSLPPKRPFKPEDIRRIRMANHISATVGAGTKEAKRPCTAASRSY